MTLELRAGVGTNRPNHRQDVATIQFFLSITVDGIFGPKTAEALAGFQSRAFGFTDGFADPGDITYKLLRGDLSASNSAAIRAAVLNYLDDPTLGPEPSTEVPTADGQGLVTVWPHGSGDAWIYSHPSWGTWEVYGLILERYDQLGSEQGPLGMPISGERDHGNGGRISFFQHGRITWESGSDSAVETIVSV